MGWSVVRGESAGSHFPAAPLAPRPAAASPQDGESDAAGRDSQGGKMNCILMIFKMK